MKKLILIPLVCATLMCSGCAFTFVPLMLLIKNDPNPQIAPQDAEIEKIVEPTAVV